MPKGNVVNMKRDVNLKFDFSRPSDRKLTDLWKGWYKQAQKSGCEHIPNVFELTGVGSQYIPLREPEISDMFIVYRIVNREDMDDLYVIVLARK